MRIIRLALFLFLTMFASSALHAQIIGDPTTWSFEAKKKDGNHYQLIFHLKIKEGWHIYALKPGGDGTLISPSFTFNKATGLRLIGNVKEKGKLITENMVGIDGAVNMYKLKVDYIQEAEITGTPKIAGKYGYQVCNDNMCLPPKTKPFTFTVADNKTSDATAPGRRTSPSPPATTLIRWWCATRRRQRGCSAIPVSTARPAPSTPRVARCSR